MCRYSDRVYNCGHYDRSCEACKSAKKSKSLCDCPDSKQKKKGAPSSNYQVTTGTWCNKEDCDSKAHNKREGPGKTTRFSQLTSIGNRFDGGFDEADYEWPDSME